MIKLNQIEPFEIGGEKIKRLQLTTPALLANVGTNNITWEYTCNIESNDKISWIEVFENGVPHIEGVTCTGISYGIGGGKLTITISETESLVEASDKITVRVFTTQENASWAA